MPEFPERSHEGGHSRGLARPRIAAHQQQVTGFILHGKPAERFKEPHLARGRPVTQVMPQPAGEKVGHAHYARFR